MPAGRPPSKEATSFGKRLAAARREVGLTQQELATKIDVTQRVIAYWERESIGLKADQLLSLAAALEVSVDSLLGNKNEVKRRGGPTGRARRLFENIDSLPRAQQRRVLDMVETVLAGQLAQSNSSS